MLQPTNVISRWRRASVNSKSIFSQRSDSGFSINKWQPRAALSKASGTCNDVGVVTKTTLGAHCHAASIWPTVLTRRLSSTSSRESDRTSNANSSAAPRLSKFFIWRLPMEPHPMTRKRHLFRSCSSTMSAHFHLYVVPLHVLAQQPCGDALLLIRPRIELLSRVVTGEHAHRVVHARG